MHARRLLGSALLAAVLGCGGGGASGPNPPPPPPPPPPGPAPVATVTLDKTTATIVPQFGLQLQATTKDAAGTTLSGRTVTWQSSTGAVASVSNDGLVTGLTVGTTTVTATSEGKSAGALITVSEGAVVGAAGGTVTLTSGAAKITIPPGALTTSMPISITPVANPASPFGVIPGTSYELGPEGTTFAQPVTLEFKYPVVPVAADSFEVLYAMHRLTAGKWVRLAGSTSNWQTRTVRAQTSSFSYYGIRWSPMLSTVVLTPVNWGLFVGQSKQFVATPLDQYGDPMIGADSLEWSGTSGAPVTAGGLVTGALPGGPYIVAGGFKQWIRCDTQPCPGTAIYWDIYSPDHGSIRVIAGSQAEVAVSLVPVKGIAVNPTPSTVPVGQVVNLTATLKDSVGGNLTTTFRNPVSWTTSNAAVASVSQAGVVTTLSPGGPVTITASLEGASGTAQVTVTGSTSTVTSVSVTPDAATIEVGTTVTLTATPKDANGVPVLGRPMVWQTLDASKATVSQSGVVTGVSPGQVGIGVTIDGVPNGALITVVAPYPLVLGSPSTGGFHTCFIRSGNTAWCWGQGTKGQLGNGTTVTEQATPVPVSGGTGYTAISGGTEHTCALDGSGLAFCWGDNSRGQLGDNSTQQSSTPVAVAGGRHFSRIYASRTKSCGLEAGGTAWCWGTGYLGDGTNPVAHGPVAVGPVPLFSELAVGDFDTCGLSLGGEAWCWGSADFDGTHLAPAVPAPTKLSGHVFTHLAGGEQDFCGLKGNGEVWCWGRNQWGQLGNGGQANQVAPVRVVTPTLFTAISAGSEFTCGLATDQTAWCWGLRGMVGNNPGSGPLGTTTPVPVLGGRAFTEIDAGGGHTCARAVDGTWCWGMNINGSLGTGIPSGGIITFVTPVKVRFP